MDRKTLENLRAMLKSGRFDQGYGIANVARRIQLFFGPTFGMEIEVTPEGGTQVSISVPVLSREELERMLETPEPIVER